MMYNTLIQILHMEDCAIYDYFGQQFGVPTVTDSNNYWYKRGEIPICLVAHIDTVSPIKTKVGRTFECKKGIIRAFSESSSGKPKPAVLGADDRAGVFAISQLAYLKPHILLTNYEECGALGVKQLLKDHDLTTWGIKFFIEIDRRGCNHYVEYNNNPLVVHKFMTSFGFENKGQGSFSDIALISSQTKIPSVNVATGYYAEHTPEEHLDVAALNLTIDKLKNVLDYADDVDEFGYIRPKTIHAPRNLSSIPAFKNIPAFYTQPSLPMEKSILIKQDELDTLVKDSKHMYLCDDCYEYEEDCVCNCPFCDEWISDCECPDHIKELVPRNLIQI